MILFKLKFSVCKIHKVCLTIAIFVKCFNENGNHIQSNNLNFNESHNETIVLFFYVSPYSPLLSILITMRTLLLMRKPSHKAEYIAFTSPYVLVTELHFYV